MISLLLVVVAQCGPGGCPMPATPGFSMASPIVIDQPVYRIAAPRAPQYDWRPARKYDWHRIRHDGLSFYVWGFVAEDGTIEWDEDLPENHEQHEKAIAAERLRRDAESRRKAVTNYGVDPSRIHKGQRYTANSAEAAHFVREAQAKVDGRTDRCYVTVIGSASERKPVADDWRSNPAFDAYRERVWFQEFDRGEWQVADDLGFQAKGKPSVLVQKSDGEVLLRSNSYRGPRPIVNALRKADPNYNPSHDPTDQQDDAASGDNRVYLAIAIVCISAIVAIPRRKP
jgi:hypothetical protein